MTVKNWLQLAAAAIAMVLVVSVVVAWRAEIREQTELKQQLKTAQQALTEAASREQARSPEDVVKALPSVLPLPEPIEMETPSTAGASGTDGRLDKPSAPQAREVGRVRLPVADLKPLYDTAVACKECQAELAAALADLKDEKTKTEALSRERDDALRVARATRRTTEPPLAGCGGAKAGGGAAAPGGQGARAAKWFVIGAAAGAVAVKLAR